MQSVRTSIGIPDDLRLEAVAKSRVDLLARFVPVIREVLARGWGCGGFRSL